MSDTFVAYLHRNNVGFNFHDSMLNMVLADRGRHIVELRDKQSGPLRLGESRNEIVTAFLQTKLEYLFMVDSDMGWQSNALEAMHAVIDPVDRPIIGGLCFMQQEKSFDGRSGNRWHPRPTIYDAVPQQNGDLLFEYRYHFPVNGLVRCDGTGGAFLLIHRRVLEKIGYGWFTQLRDSRGPVSEDLSFFTRCHKLGIPCHIFTGVKTNHMKETWVSESDFWADFDAPPATEQVDVIVPVLHRPQNVRPFMESLRASTGLATAWFVCERNDREEQDEVLAHGGRVLKCDGTFAEKANYAYNKLTPKAPWLFLAGDDVQFRPGWLDHAQFVGNAYGGSVVGTNDLGNPRVMRGDHATHLLIKRSYVDEVGASWDGPGALCHAGYRHWFVDDEIVTAAQQRNAWQMALGSLVEHMHPYWGKATGDAVYELGESKRDEDRALFEKRLAAQMAVAA